MENLQIKHFVERRYDEYNNRLYTVKKPYVISAYYEPGTGQKGTLGSLGRLHVIQPSFIKENWSTLSERFFIEVDLPVGEISEKKWLELTPPVKPY